MNHAAIILSLLLTSLLAASGAFLLFLKKEHLDRILIYLVALSTGAIFGGVFIHLVPRYANTTGFTHATGLVVIAGIAVSHALEKLFHWHCHRVDHDIEPFSYMILAGDGFHNIIDGILITSSYIASTSAGVAATIAVVLHKVPKEVGDFGTLVHGGFSPKKALGFNIGIGIFMFIGAGLTIFAADYQGIEKLLIPFTIGNFTYIAGTDLLPEIKAGENHNWPLSYTVMLTGAALMYSIVLLKPVLGI